MDQATMKKLTQAAMAARDRAYAPYSGFTVGAALLSSDGRVFTGCNIENASYGAANCAERTAVFNAVNEGEQEFLAVAIAGGAEGQPVEDYCPPCGICRQVLAEFCQPDASVILVIAGGKLKVLSIGELLPHSFTKEKLT